MLLGIVGAGVTAVLTYRSPQLYEATATIQIRPVPTATQGGGASVDQVAKTDSVLIMKRPMVERVIRELHLRDTADELSLRLTASPQQATNLLEIKAQDANPSLAAQIANALAEDFISEDRQAQGQQRAASIASLQAQIDTLQTQLQIETHDASVLQAKPHLTPDDQAALTILQQRQASDSFVFSSLLKDYDAVQSNQFVNYQLVVADPAATPQQPVHKGRFLKVLLAGVLGVVVAVAIVYLINTPATASLEPRRLTAVK